MAQKRRSLFLYELAITVEAEYKSLGFVVIYRRWLRWPRVRLSFWWKEAKARWVPLQLLTSFARSGSRYQAAFFPTHEHALTYVGEVQLSGRLRHRPKSDTTEAAIPPQYIASQTTRFKLDD